MSFIEMVTIQKEVHENGKEQKRKKEKQNKQNKPETGNPKLDGPNFPAT